MTRVIVPVKGRILVQLGASEWGDIPVPEKTFDSVTNGVVIKVHPDDEKEYGDWVGEQAYWKLYKDDLRVATLPDGGKLAIILISDIDGTSYEGEQ
jgi:hypothetical protein